MKSLVLIGLFGVSVASLLGQEASGLLYERWGGIAPSASVLELQKSGILVRAADSFGTVDGADWEGAAGDQYGVRLRGWVVAPVSGHYTFFVSGDDNVALWLSPDASRSNKQLLAWHHHWTGRSQWNQYASQRSRLVRLAEGERYYIEAQMMDLGGGDHLSIGWAFEGAAPLVVSAVGDSQIADYVADDESVSLDVEGGDIWGNSDRFAFAHREWTGDGELVARVAGVDHPNRWSKVGLMVRAGVSADSAHAMIARTGGAGTVFQRRRTNGGGSHHAGVEHDYEWLKLARTGDTISAYGSDDGRSWSYIGRDDLPNLPETVLVGVAATDNVGSEALGVVVDQIALRPMVADAVVPSEFLIPHVNAPEDADDDGLPDDWELQNQINAESALGDAGEYGDPDHDGLTNIAEFQRGTDPMVANAVTGGLTRERWESLGGDRLVDLTDHHRARFLREPNERVHVASVDATEHGDNYATRYRGTITAPVDGAYEFWIAGDDEVELWIADGTVVVDGVAQTGRFGKRRVAWVRDERLNLNYTGDEDFDRYPNQNTGLLELVAGDTYYIEVLHKEGESADHVSLAWRAPGGDREAVPYNVFSSDVKGASDVDDDYLPNSWELQFGLNPSDNGAVDPRDGQFGDWDDDGLTNLDEYQLGTNPTLADTDGDSLSDADELELYGSDPTVNDAVPPVKFVDIDLTGYVEADLPWEPVDGGGVASMDRRGWADYRLSVQSGEEGVFEVRLTGAAKRSTRRVDELPVEFQLDGTRIGNGIIRSVDGASDEIRVMTPWLGVGDYTLRVHSTNYRANLQLRIDALAVYRVGGVDLDADGQVDWVAKRLSDENYMTVWPTSSYVSPVCIEGVTSHLGGLTIERDVAGGSSGGVPVAVYQGVDHGFFANVQLAADGPTDLAVGFQYGAIDDVQAIEWSPINVLDRESITIRKGDALRVAAWLPAQASPGSFTLTRDGVAVMADDGGGVYSADSPVEIQFTDAGEFTFDASWSPAGGGTPATGVLTVRVVDADFDGGIDVMAWHRRTWTLTGMEGLNLDADSTLVWHEQPPSGDGVREFTVDIYEVGSRYVLARLPETGQVVARGEVRGFYLAGEQETLDAQKYGAYPDGTRRYRFTMVADGLPEGIEIHIRSYYQGTVFPDGGNEWVLTAKDFNSLGVADVYMECGPDGEARLCHTIDVIDVRD